MCSIASTRDVTVFSLRIVACVYLIQVSIRCCHGCARGSATVCSLRPGCGDTNIKSCRTTSLKAAVNREVVVEAGVGRFHVRHARHVSTMESTSLRTSSGATADLSSCFIRAALQCHHRICNVRSVLLTTPGFLERSSCKLCPRSQALQSAVASSACVDVWRPSEGRPKG